LVRANYCKTETWIRRYLTQLFALPFLNNYPVEDCFVENPLSATPQDFRFGQFRDEQMLEKHKGAIKNKESRHWQKKNH
jgi:hypothetical protein